MFRRQACIPPHHLKDTSSASFFEIFLPRACRWSGPADIVALHCIDRLPQDGIHQSGRAKNPEERRLAPLTGVFPLISRNLLLSSTYALCNLRGARLVSGSHQFSTAGFRPPSSRLRDFSPICGIMVSLACAWVRWVFHGGFGTHQRSSSEDFRLPACIAPSGTMQDPHDERTPENR